MKIKIINPVEKLIDVSKENIFNFIQLQQMYDVNPDCDFELPDHFLEEDISDALNSPNGEAKTFPGLYLQDFLCGNIFRLTIDNIEINNNIVKYNDVELSINFDKFIIRYDRNFNFDLKRIKTNFPKYCQGFHKKRYCQIVYSLDLYKSFSVDERSLYFMKLCGKNNVLFETALRSIQSFCKSFSLINNLYEEMKINEQGLSLISKIKTLLIDEMKINEQGLSLISKIKTLLIDDKNNNKINLDIYYDICSHPIFHQEMLKRYKDEKFIDYILNDEKCMYTTTNGKYTHISRANTAGGLLLQEANGIEFYHNIIIVPKSDMDAFYSKKILGQEWEMLMNDIVDTQLCNVTIIPHNHNKIRLIHSKDSIFKNVKKIDDKLSLSIKEHEIYIELIGENMAKLAFCSNYVISYDMKSKIYTQLSCDNCKIREVELTGIFPIHPTNFVWMTYSKKVNLNALSKRFWILLKNTRLINFRNYVTKELIDNFDFGTVFYFFKEDKIVMNEYINFLLEMKLLCRIE